MGVSIAIVKSHNVQGQSFSEQQTLTAPFVDYVETSVIAAQPGSLPSSGTPNTATLTMTNGGHGITTGSRIDIYWVNAGLFYCRRGVKVGTVSGVNVPLLTGFAEGGDSLPATTVQAVNVGLCQQINFAFDGTKVTALLLYTPYRGVFVFQTSTGVAGTEQYARQLGDGITTSWYQGPGGRNDSGDPNPIAATLTSVQLSHGNTGAAQTMRIGILRSA